MLEGVVRAQILPKMAGFLNDIQSDRLLVHFEIFGEGTYPAHDFITKDKLSQRKRESGFQISEIMNDVASGKCLRHQGQSSLRCRLLVRNLGFGYPCQREHGKMVKMAHCLDDGSFRLSIGGHHGPHVKCPAGRHS